MTVAPSHVSFYSKGNEIISREVEVRAELPRPLTLSSNQFSLAGVLTYRIDEIEKGKKFKILFKNIPGLVGNFRGFLKLQTNYPEKPEIVIWISVRSVGEQRPS